MANLMIFVWTVWPRRQMTPIEAYATLIELGLTLSIELLLIVRYEVIRWRRAS